MFVSSKVSTSSQSKNTAQTKLAYEQKAKQFCTQANQQLKPLINNTSTPALQAQALTQTRKVLTEAKLVAQSNPQSADAAKITASLDHLAQETQQVKTVVDQAAVVKMQTKTSEEPLKAFKSQLVHNMIQGLASAIPEVRQNARMALSRLGVTEKELDRLRLELEHNKMQQLNKRPQFAGHYPVKLNTPAGVRFSGIADGCGGGTPLPGGDDRGILFSGDIVDKVVDNNSFNDIAEQAVSYQVNNVTNQLHPLLFGAGGWVPNGTDGKGNTLYEWSNNV